MSSVSNCFDWQIQRARFLQQYNPKNKKISWTLRDTSSNSDFEITPHTLNGSGLALGRILAAFIETHWDSSQNKLRIPLHLRSFFNGLEYL